MSRRLWVPRTHSARTQDVRASAPAASREAARVPAAQPAARESAAAAPPRPGKGRGRRRWPRDWSPLTPGWSAQARAPAGWLAARARAGAARGGEEATRIWEEKARRGAARGGRGNARRPSRQEAPGSQPGTSGRCLPPAPTPLAASPAPGAGPLPEGHQALPGAGPPSADSAGPAPPDSAGLGPLLEGRPAPPAPGHLPPPTGWPRGGRCSLPDPGLRGSAAPRARRRQGRAAPRGEGAFKATHTPPSAELEC